MATDPGSIASTVLAAHDAARTLDRFTLADPAFDLVAAYRAAAALARLRHGRGEQVVGCKVGFTNRRTWAAYGIDRPIFAPVYDTTVAPLHETLAVGRLLEPRIEPEIVLRLSRPPEPEMAEAELMACVEAVAHAFEVVECPFEGWRFAVPDAVAASGLHAALRHGPFVPVLSADHATWIAGFRSARVTLSRNGVEVAAGSPVAVLDAGPLAALAALAAFAAAHPEMPSPQPGWMVTTGTMTEAPAVSAGEAWTTALEGLPLPGLSLRLA